MFYYRVIRITQDKVKSSSGVRDSVFILSKCLFILNVYLISLKSNLKLFFFWLCHTACRRIISSQIGIKPGPSQLKHQVLSTRPPGNSQCCLTLVFTLNICMLGNVEYLSVVTKLTPPLSRLCKLCEIFWKVKSTKSLSF